MKEIQSLLEYAVPVWYSSITRQQSNAIEKIQRWAVSLILDNWTFSYRIKCTLLSLEPLFLRRKGLALSFAKKTAENPRHSAFFTKHKSAYNTRNSGKMYVEHKARSSRFQKSPLVSLTADLNQHIQNKTRYA